MSEPEERKKQVLSFGEIRVSRETFDKLGRKLVVAINGGNEFTHIIVTEPDGSETHL